MHKPDGTDQGPQAHHYALHLAHSWHCEHTCGAQRPSEHRAGRGAGPQAHALPHFHDNHVELKTLPGKKRTGELALDMLAELKASEHLPPHLYSAIWTQVHHALTATARCRRNTHSTDRPRRTSYKQREPVVSADSLGLLARSHAGCKNLVTDRPRTSP